MDALLGCEPSSQSTLVRELHANAVNSVKTDRPVFRRHANGLNVRRRRVVVDSVVTAYGGFVGAAIAVRVPDIRDADLAFHDSENRVVVALLTRFDFLLVIECPGALLILRGQVVRVGGRV